MISDGPEEAWGYRRVFRPNSKRGSGIIVIAKVLLSSGLELQLCRNHVRDLYFIPN